MEYEKVSMIQLTPSAIRCLKYLCRKYNSARGQYNGESFSMLEDHFSSGKWIGVLGPNVNALVALGLLQHRTPYADYVSYYEITREGIDWLEFHKARERKFWIPIVISSIALIVSIVALIST